MNTYQSLQALEVIDDLLQFVLFEKAKTRDIHAPKEQELKLRSAFYDRWDRQVMVAKLALQHRATSSTDQIMDVFNKAFSGRAITDGVASAASISIAESFVIGKVTVDDQYKKQTGKAPAQKDVMFGAMFGLTEQHALQALNEQIMIAAGQFWDDQLQESIQKEVTSWFEGSVTRDQLVTKLSELVNTRLATEGKSLARSYFDNLATHYVNRSRNIGSVYRAKALGAQKYRLVNPHDHRTSLICREVTNGQVYEMAGAEGVVTDLLQSRTTADLKAKVPFLTAATASSATAPVPPLHFGGCRTWMEYIFEGLT